MFHNVCVCVCVCVCVVFFIKGLLNMFCQFVNCASKKCPIFDCAVMIGFVIITD